MCVCGHPHVLHSEHADVPCEGDHFVAPGSFVACECDGFVPSTATCADYPDVLVSDAMHLELAILEEIDEDEAVAAVLIALREGWRPRAAVIEQTCKQTNDEETDG